MPKQAGPVMWSTSGQPTFLRSDGGAGWRAGGFLALGLVILGPYERLRVWIRVRRNEKKGKERVNEEYVTK